MNEAFEPNFSSGSAQQTAASRTGGLSKRDESVPQSVHALDEFLNKARHLPPTPKTLVRLLALINEPNVDVSKVVELITFDPVLTANLLQACNSTYFSSAEPVVSVQEAVTRLGFEQVYRVAATVCGAQMFGVLQPGWGIDCADLWRHSITCAISSQLVARETNHDESIAFTAGLIHDIGKIILACSLERTYARVVVEAERNQYCLLETEKRLLGIQHAEIAGRWLARWAFPPTLVDAVWHHHQPKAAGPNQRLAACVHIGNIVAHLVGRSSGTHPLSLLGRTDALAVLNLSNDRMARFLAQTLENTTLADMMLSVHT